MERKDCRSDGLFYFIQQAGAETGVESARCIIIQESIHFFYQ